MNGILNRSMAFYWLLLWFSLEGIGHGFELDGSLSDDEWQAAKSFDTFIVTQPQTGKQPELRTIVKYFSSAEGIYIGIDNLQESDLNSTTLSSRDSGFVADSNRILIDFDNNGQTAYEFSINSAGSIQDAIWSNGNSRSSEWDGNWQSASSIHERGWSSEVFIPWTVAPMVSVSEGQRSVKLLVNRRIFKQSRTFSSGAADESNPSFLQTMPVISVANFSSSSINRFINLVTSFDANTGETDFEVGGDIFWKPSPNQQLSLTIKPDFSQVDSDEVVINFSPDEAFFSEKRSFFTENQAVFTPTRPLSVPFTPNIRLIHTRRIGSSPDGGDKLIADILAAGKYTITTQNLNLGLFSAIEEDDGDFEGKNFYAGRAVYNQGNNSYAAAVTFTDRPVLKRTALVTNGEARLAFGDKLTANLSVMSSQIELDDEAEDDTSGQGGFANLVYNPNANITHRLQLLGLDQQLDINDLGFLSRNNVKILGYDASLKIPYQDQKLQVDEWAVGAGVRENFDSERLSSFFRLERVRFYTDTSRVVTFFEHFTKGLDDRISRGNGSVYIDALTLAFFEYFWDQSGAFRHHVGAFYTNGGTAGDENWWHYHPSYFFDDQTNVSLSLIYRTNRNWLNWTGDFDEQSESSFGIFDRELFRTDINLNHNFTSKQELRLNAQWLGIKAKYKESREIINNRLVPVANNSNLDFTRSTLAVQLRYRYQLSPLSSLFLVYSRGGSEGCDDCRPSLSTVFSEGTSNQDANQFLAKLRLSI